MRQIADVYINGTFVGKNQTGFIPFGYDLTPYIKFGEDNVVAVRLIMTAAIISVTTSLWYGTTNIGILIMVESIVMSIFMS